MENSWQMKCGSSTQSMASAASQEPRNQMEVNSGYYLHPHGAFDFRSNVRGNMQESAVPNIQNTSSCRQGHAELGNSFLALLSGPLPLLQCDIKEQSNLKSFSASSGKLSFDSSAVTITPVGSGVTPITSGVLSGCQSTRNIQTGTNFCPILSSRAVTNSNYGTRSVLHDGLEAVNLSLQSSDLAKAVVHHLVSSNERTKDVSSVNGKWNMSSAHATKLSSSCIPISQKVPLQSNSSLSSQPSIYTSECPRVICLGASGNLLLSNTGLLGIVCSCHHFHMSVAKFCEHLGLCDVNPGDAVHMESGETIAQWRKLYFQKFGIRVPDDQSGWGWPEAFPATAGLVKSSVAVSNIVNNSDLRKLVGSSGGLTKSGQSLDNIVFPKFPKNPHTDQNLVVDALRDKERSYSVDNTNCLLKGFINTLESNTHVVSDNQIMEGPASRCSTSSKSIDRGPDCGLQSLSAYIDSFLKSRNSSISNPTAQNSRTYSKNYNANKTKNARDVVVADMVGTSSNVELRLGQPYQQIQSSGNSAPSVAGPKILDTLVAPTKSLFLEQMTNNATNCGEKVASNLYFQCSTGPANLSARREISQLNLGKHVFGISNATDTAKLEKCEGNATKSFAVPLLTRFNTPSERNENSKPNNHMVSSDHVMPKSIHCEPYSAKSPQVSVPWSVITGSERQLNVSESGFFGLKDKGKRVECTADVPYASADSEFNIQKQLETHGIFLGAVSGSSDPCSAAVQEKSNYSYQSSGVPPFDGRNIFNLSEKVPSFGSSRQTDQRFLTSKPPLGSVQLLQSQAQAVSMAFPLATSTSFQGVAPAVSKLDGISASPYLLDDNTRLLALGQILELSKQQHAISSLGMDREAGRRDSVCNGNLQHPFVEPSIFGEQTLGPNITGQRNVSEVAMLSPPSGAYTRLGLNTDKSGPVTDLSNFHEFSNWMRGNPPLPREIDLQCQFPRDPLPNKQLSFRSEHISSSIENSKCYQGVSCTNSQGHFGCAANIKCSGGNCESTIGNSPNAFKEQGNVNGETSMLVASEFVKDDRGTKEKIISLDQRAKLKGQVPKHTTFCHASQWRDVPGKFKGVSDVTCLDRSADLLGGSGGTEGQLGVTGTTKCSYGTMKVPDSLKELEMSNISSGCSAAAVTHASIQTNTIDSSIVNGENTRYLNNHPVDEGSVIDRCWSSDDALESERSAEFLGSNCKTNFSKEGSSKIKNNQSSCSLLDELKLLNPLTWKKSRNRIHTGLAVHAKINLKKKERGFKTGKRKRPRKYKMLESSIPSAGPSTVHYGHAKGTGSFEPCPSKDVEMLLPSFQGTYISGAHSLQPSSKCGRSTFSSSKKLSRKRDLLMIYGDGDGDGDGEDDYQMESNSFANPCKSHDFSGIRKLRRDWDSDCIRKSQMEEPTRVHSKITVRCRPVGYVKASSYGQVNACYKKARPVVCGKYGEICGGELAGDVLQPAKIVSLSRILKTARKCTLPKKWESKPTFHNEWKKANFCGRDAEDGGLSNLKKEEENGIHHSSICNQRNINHCLEEDENVFTNGDKLFVEEKSDLEKGNDNRKRISGIILNRNVHTKFKPKNKGIRKRSLCELAEKGKELSSESFPRMRISKCVPKTEVGKVPKNAGGNKHHVRESCKVNSEKLNQVHRLPIMYLDAFCCVCGGSNNDEINCILECSRCFIKVHQACYGVSRVPKGHWHCRPCRTSARDIVCVLCGYGGGAMTRALQSRAMVKSLLKAWNVETESRHNSAVCSAEIMEDDLSVCPSSRSMLQYNTFPVLRPVNSEPSTAAALKVDLQSRLDIVQNSICTASNLKLHNSFTAGLLDSTVKQWVHMVCGLWTPGTRCPNVDTMSAFDVSGVSCPKANVVCSMCNRPGGSCIKCRVVNCSVRFHPWCAHQKGLLQSEVEGFENENVGFYGRCVLHATHPLCESGSDSIDLKADCSLEKELTCARTEGYKGRKRDGFWHNLYGQSRGKNGCLVPQEQLNAWIHINGQKSCTNGLPKLPVSDIEYDYRKEYTRYKQAKGWRHLVVYKSGIHALGLYTSRFIARGEMVVEYVGQIVGLRVADKREIEYQSGRKLQYKSACYFFRIDKEQIIDATCKGGIARFVNHSCLPNCVAKVISVRNEKKVVFFAERDIYPGEEITYDYHFNHEDEGKKIPCFCSSKNCRRYLN